MTRTISVLLADDHALVRGALEQWLTQAPDIAVVAAVPDADTAVSEAVRSHPDVVLLDVDMPGLHAFEAAKMIRLRSPDTRVLFVSAYSHDRYIELALAAGAMGYVTKAESPDAVLRAIRAVAQGGVYFSPDVHARIVVDAHGPTLAQRPKTRTSSLTARELEVLRYLASGLAKKQIAETMKLSLGTVNNHAANLMKKLDIHDRVELARFAIREGLVVT